MTVPSDNLPAYVTLDRNSLWHVSGLISTALESMTLPSRLKAKDGTRETLDDLAAVLNVNGNQNIAKLQMSIRPTSKSAQQDNHGRSGRLAVHGQDADLRTPFREGWRDEVEMSGEAASNPMDIDFFPSNEPNQDRRRQKSKTMHIFGEVQNFRGHEDELPENYVEEVKHGVDGRDRARRRAASLPILHRLVMSRLFTSLMRTSQQFRAVTSYCGTLELHAIVSRLYPMRPCTVTKVPIYSIGGYW